MSIIHVGSYTPEGDGTGRGITAWTSDPATGALSPAPGAADADGLVAACPSPSYLIHNQPGDLLYAVLEMTGGPHGAVTGFAVNRRTGALNPLGTPASTHGEAPCHLALHPGGRLLVTANYGSGSLSVHPVDKDGTPLAATQLVRHTGSGPVTDRQQGPHAHQVTFTDDGRHLLAVDLGADTIFRYTVDLDARQLVAAGATHLPPGTGPRHLAIARDTGLAYLAGELNNTVTVLRLTDTGADVLRQVACTADPTGSHGSGAGTGNLPAAIRISADGRLCYVTNRGADTLATLAVEDDNLRLLGEVPSGGAWPRDFAIVGDHGYVANQNSGTVAAFVLVGDGALPRAAGMPLRVASAVGLSAQA